LKAMLIAVVYSFTISFLIFKLINFIVPLRVSNKEEEEGLDISQHDEKYGSTMILAGHRTGFRELEPSNH
jgi:Amt family ammonium transporter